ncbi:MAG: virulence RhuM family protein [Bacillota bacterium]
MKNKKTILRSSVAEYLTFISTTGDGGVETIYADENVWITQKMMAELYQVKTNTINYHLKKIFEDSEIEENSVIRKFRITASDNKTYDTKHYNLKATIAVGNKVDSPRAVQFRKWANTIIEEYTIKAYAMDDERLKNSGSILTKKYFEEQLQRIREIRISERKFYQKITDIYATSLDYDSTSNVTKIFFSKVQNKLHWAIHGQTAAEVIYDRADAEKENMGLMTWKDAPDGKIQKFDVTVAKNYLSEKELQAMSRIVTSYLDLAESQAERNIPMTMEDWVEQFDGLLKLSRREILTHAGKISAEIAKKHAETEFKKYRIIQDRLFENAFDKFIIEEIKGEAGGDDE